MQEILCKLRHNIIPINIKATHWYHKLVFVVFVSCLASDVVNFEYEFEGKLIRDEVQHLAIVQLYFLTLEQRSLNC